MKEAFNNLIVRAGEILTNRYATGEITHDVYQYEMDKLIKLIQTYNIKLIKLIQTHNIK